MAKPKNFLKKSDSEWVCRECGHPCGEDRGAAEALMVAHMENHGSVADSPRGADGRSGPEGGVMGFLGGVLDIVADILD